MFVFPIAVCAQQPWYKSSPLDYMWQNVGNAGFSAGVASDISLAFSPSGQPYVAYEDYGNAEKATVMKFDGTNWVNVGNAGFSAGTTDCESLAFNPSSGDPYVAYEDGANSYKTTVMDYAAPAGIMELKSSQITIYPNPARDKCEVRSAKCDIKSIEIFNLTGEKVYAADFSSGTDNDVEVDFNLPSGIYFMKVMDERKMNVQKLIVE